MAENNDLGTDKESHSGLLTLKKQLVTYSYITCWSQPPHRVRNDNLVQTIQGQELPSLTCGRTWWCIIQSLEVDDTEPSFPGATTPTATESNISWRSWDFLEPAHPPGWRAHFALLSLCFTLIDLFLCNSPLSLSLNSDSDETNNFLAPGPSDPNPVTVSMWLSMTMVLFQRQKSYRPWR
jgi:hypothetical protein